MIRSHKVGLALALFLGLSTVACTTTTPIVYSPVAPVAEEPIAPVDPIASTDVGSLKTQLASRRTKQLDRLHAYWTAGEFPKNDVRPELANVFMDEDGHLCAVANLVRLDGLEDVVQKTARENNMVRIADEESGALHDWVLTSGFTRDEIAMIQAPYAPMEPQADFSQRERERLQRRLAGVEAQLRAQTSTSLELAAQRLHVERERVAVRPSRLTAPRTQFATPPGAVVARD